MIALEILDIVEEKRRIREKARRRRDLLDPAVRGKASQTIATALFSLAEFRESRTVQFYLSFAGEVETEEMISRAMVEGKRVVAPAIGSSGKELLLHELSFGVIPKKGRWGVPEPPEGRAVPIDEIDLLVVPGVAFDEEGRRIGYGRGYYDRLLARAGNLMTIGLAYELQIYPHLPEGPEDRRVRGVVTELRVIRAVRDPRKI